MIYVIIGLIVLYILYKIGDFLLKVVLALLLIAGSIYLVHNYSNLEKPNLTIHDSK